MVFPLHDPTAIIGVFQYILELWIMIPREQIWNWLFSITRSTTNNTVLDQPRRQIEAGRIVFLRLHEAQEIIARTISRALSEASW